MYESYKEILTKHHSKEEFKKLSIEEQEEWVDTVYNIYSTIGVLPVKSLGEEDMIEEVRRCFKYTPLIKDNVLDTGRGVGTKLCSYLFPNLYDVIALQNVYKNKGGESLRKRFNSEKYLKKSIRFALRSRNGGATPTNVFGGLEMTGATPSNFRPMNARAIYERYCPSGGIVYDFASGFGGRLLGCLTSPNNYKYIGVEPNKETFENLNKLGDIIEKALDKNNVFKIFNEVSEEFKVQQETVDFAFSSPPYFNLEQYSEEETQCYNKFPTLDEWLSGYVRPTIENIHYMLKKDCYYAVNIQDFQINNKIDCAFVDTWISISKDVGFEFVDKLTLKTPIRVGNGKEKRYSKDKNEGIYVFKKVIRNI